MTLPCKHHHILKVTDTEEEGSWSEQGGWEGHGLEFYTGWSR